MKKTVSIVLVMSLLLVFGTVCYADTGGQIPGEYKLFLVDVMGQQSDSKRHGDGSFVLTEQMMDDMIVTRKVIICPGRREKSQVRESIM